MSHMFFKDKLQHMANVFKEHLNKACDKWLAEIEQKGKTRINIAEVFEHIFAETISHICFGKNYNDDKFNWNLYDRQKDIFIETKVSMKEAMGNMSL